MSVLAFDMHTYFLMFLKIYETLVLLNLYLNMTDYQFSMLCITLTINNKFQGFFEAILGTVISYGASLKNIIG